MHFQVRTDNHISNNESLGERIRALVDGGLGDRYHRRIRRIEVYLQDVNGHKKGPDLRCSIEAGLAGHEPVVVHEQGGDLDGVVSAATVKLLRALDSTLGRLDDRKGRVSMSGEST